MWSKYNNEIRKPKIMDDAKMQAAEVIVKVMRSYKACKEVRKMEE